MCPNTCIYIIEGVRNFTSTHLNKNTGKNISFVRFVGRLLTMVGNKSIVWTQIIDKIVNSFCIAGMLSLKHIKTQINVCIIYIFIIVII